MGSKTDYLEEKWLDHTLRGTTYTAPAAVYSALFTAIPSDAGGGTEVSGNGYSRVEVNPLDANWAAPAGGNGVTSNVSAITFPTPSASWGTVTHFGIFDAASAGNLLFQGSLGSGKVINSGDTVSFAAGALQLSFA
jgi:hypothetical protein